PTGIQPPPLHDALPISVGERPEALAHAFGSQAEVKVERRIESGEERRIPRAILHEPVHAVFLIVPRKTAQSGTIRKTASTGSCRDRKSTRLNSSHVAIS